MEKIISSNTNKINGYTGEKITERLYLTKDDLENIITNYLRNNAKIAYVNTGIGSTDEIKGVSVITNDTYKK